MTASAVDGRCVADPLPGEDGDGRLAEWKEAGPMSVTDPELIIDDCEAGIFRVNREVMTSPAVLAAERTRIFDKFWLYLWTRVRRSNKPGDYKPPHCARAARSSSSATRRQLWMFFYDHVPLTEERRCAQRGRQRQALHVLLPRMDL